MAAAQLTRHRPASGTVRRQCPSFLKPKKLKKLRGRRMSASGSFNVQTFVLAVLPCAARETQQIGGCPCTKNGAKCQEKKLGLNKKSCFGIFLKKIQNYGEKTIFPQKNSLRSSRGGGSQTPVCQGGGQAPPEQHQRSLPIEQHQRPTEVLLKSPLRLKKPPQDMPPFATFRPQRSKLDQWDLCIVVLC